MATVKVIDLINRAEEILQDTTNVRWSQQTLLNYLNDGQREIVLFRPDANPVNASFNKRFQVQDLDYYLFTETLHLQQNQ